MSWMYLWVVALILPYLYCLRRCPRQEAVQIFSNLPLLREVSARSSRFDPALWLRIGSVLLLLGALARPVLPHTTTPETHEAHTFALLLDASNSMHEEERFAAAKKTLQHFVAARPHDRFALEVFADFAAISVPMTDDRQAIETALKHLEIGAAGGRSTALYEALYRGVDLFGKDVGKHPVIILLTDGLNTVTSIPLRVALARVRAQHIRVYTIGLGHDYQRPVLEKIAWETGGRFFPLASPDRLEEVYDQINRLEPSIVHSSRHGDHRELYRYPLMGALGLMLLLLIYRRPSGIGLWLHFAALLILVIALLAPLTSQNRTGSATAYAPALLALDLSPAMDANDLYPDRLTVAKTEALRLLDTLEGQPVGLMGFTDQAYLISPPTEDHAILRNLIAHLDPSMIERKEANLTAPIAAAVQMLPHQRPRRLLLLTSGGKHPLSSAIAQARSKHIALSVYGIGTPRGSTIPTADGVKRMPDGTPELTQLYPGLSTLADATGGIYRMWHSGEDLAPFRRALRHTVVTSAQGETHHPSVWTMLMMAAGLLLFVLSHLRLGRRI